MSGQDVSRGCDGCRSCCRSSRDEAGGGNSKETFCSSPVCCRPLWCKTRSSSSSSSRGGRPRANAYRNQTRGIPSRRNGRNNNLTLNSSSGRRGGSGIKASGVFLGFGLALEVAATLWAFQQAAQAGALRGDPDGTAGLAIAALAVALSAEAVEAAVGVACLRDPSRRGGVALLTGAAAAEGIGVVAVAAMLMLFLPSFAAAAPDDDTGATPRDEAWLVWMAVASAIAGVLFEAIPAGFDRAAARLPFLGAVGHALLWLGIAALEVLVAFFLVREEQGGEGSATSVATPAAAVGQRKTLAAVLEDDGEMVGLVVVEAVALVAMWIARVLWTRARLLQAVKGQEGPSRRRSSHFTRFDSV